MAEVTFNKDGFAVILVYIKQCATPIMTPLAYKVDTGANCTTMSRGWLNSLGYNESWIKANGILLEGDGRPTVASGECINDCYRIALPEINIGGWVGYNWLVITSLTVPFRLLLGTDSIQFFNWCFDYEKRACRFELISDKRQLLFNNKEQSIHTIDETRQTM